LKSVKVASLISAKVFVGVVALSFAAIPVQAAEVPEFDHIFLYVLENLSLGEISGNPDAQFLNGPQPHDWSRGVATDFHGITHPSLPNYMALTGGNPFFASNCHINLGTGACTTPAPSIADSIEASGRSWKAYMEDMPSPCFIGDKYPMLGRPPAYVEKHNPFIHYDNIRSDPSRCNRIVPYSQLSTDLSQGTVPDFVWITPNMCHDMHDPCGLSLVRAGDEWLSAEVPKVQNFCVASHSRCLIIITFDEGDRRLPAPEDNHIFTVLISRGPAAFRARDSNVRYDHYSLLRTMEEFWELAPPILTDNDAAAIPMLDMFPFALAKPTPASGSFAGSSTVIDSRPADGNTIITSADTFVIAGTLAGTCSGEEMDVIHPDGSVTVQGTCTFTGGVFGLSGAATVLFDATGIAGASAQGQFVIKGSSGGLAYLHGQGTFEFTVTGPGTFSGAYSGEIHFDPP
jgi:acid phosphatase